MVLAKESLMDPIDIQELIARGPQNKTEELRIKIFEEVNKLGIGAQGLGGLTTVLDVKIKDYPTHAASLPVARHTQLRSYAACAPDTRRLWAGLSRPTQTRRTGRTSNGRQKVQNASMSTSSRNLISPPSNLVKPCS